MKLFRAEPNRGWPLGSSSEAAGVVGRAEDGEGRSPFLMVGGVVLSHMWPADRSAICTCAMDARYSHSAWWHQLRKELLDNAERVQLIMPGWRDERHTRQVLSHLLQAVDRFKHEGLEIEVQARSAPAGAMAASSFLSGMKRLSAKRGGLVALDLHGSRASREEVQAIILLLKSPRLARLDLSFTRMGDEALTSLAECHANTWRGQCSECPPLVLQQLNLRNNMKLRVYAGAPLNCVLQGSPLLCDLDLEGNGIGPEGAAELGKSLAHCAMLEKLRLGDNPLQDQGVASVIQALGPLHHLQTLTLSRTQMGVRGASQLSEALFSGLPSLLDLDVSNNKLDHAACLCLASGLANCPSLVQLSMREVGFAADAAQCLAMAFKELPLLRRLEMSGNCSDSGDGATWVKGIVSGLATCKELRYLDISGNEIGDGGAEELEGLLRVNSTLQNLRLWGNHISELGMCRLVEALQNFPGQANLTVLDIGYNEIGVAGGKALASWLQRGCCPELQSLDVRQSSIPTATRRALLDAGRPRSSKLAIDFFGNPVEPNGGRHRACAVTERGETVSIQIGPMEVNIGGLWRMAVGFLMAAVIVMRLIEAGALSWAKIY